MTNHINNSADLVCTKTFEAQGLDDALLMWLHVIGASEDFNGVQTTNVSRIEADDRRVWQADLADKSSVEVTITIKDGKAALVLGHAHLPGSAAISAWEAYWKNLLATL